MVQSILLVDSFQLDLGRPDPLIFRPDCHKLDFYHRGFLGKRPHTLSPQIPGSVGVQIKPKKKKLFCQLANKNSLKF